MENKIITITKDSPYLHDLINLELLLWPDHDYQELYDDTKDSNDHYFGYLHEDELIRFIQLSIRHDYVSGAHTSPVGYVEGIYVKEPYRKQGIAKALMDYSCAFLKVQGFQEIASDALIDNVESHKFHLKMGFEEVERITCFIRKL